MDSGGTGKIERRMRGNCDLKMVTFFGYLIVTLHLFTGTTSGNSF